MKKRVNSELSTKAVGKARASKDELKKKDPKKETAEKILNDNTRRNDEGRSNRDNDNGQQKAGS